MYAFLWLQMHTTVTSRSLLLPLVRTPAQSFGSCKQLQGFPGGAVVECLPVQEVQEMCLWSLGQEDPLEKEMANPLQYSCLENSMDRGTWQATAYEVTKSQAWLSAHTHTHTEPVIKHFWNYSCKWFMYMFMYMLSRLVVSDSLWPLGAVLCQAPLSMGFLKQGYGDALPFPIPGDLPHPGIEPESPALAGGSLPLCLLGST